MNLNTGGFAAPVDGIYHFEFRCLKDSEKEEPHESIVYLVVKEKIHLFQTLLIGSFQFLLLQKQNSTNIFIIALDLLKFILKSTNTQVFVKY